MYSKKSESILFFLDCLDNKNSVFVLRRAVKTRVLRVRAEVSKVQGIQEGSGSEPRSLKDKVSKRAQGQSQDL